MLQVSRKERIQQLERKRAELIRSVIRTEEMILGSFLSIYRKCGKSNCWCAKGEGGHQLNRVGWTKSSGSKSRSVPRQDVAWAKRMTENRKKFRKQRQQIKSLEKEINKEIDELEEEALKNTTEKKPWLK